MAETSSTINEAIKFAQSVLDAKPGTVVNVAHHFNYFGRRTKFKKHGLGFDLENQGRVVYMVPGQARALQLTDSEQIADHRAGRIPQHNSPGFFHNQLGIITSSSLNEYLNFTNIETLESSGFSQQNSILTKRKLSHLAKQFCNLTTQGFKGMMCLDGDSDKRDFEIWTRYKDNFTIQVAYINPELGCIQFIQEITRNNYMSIVDVKHIVFEMGIALVINQTCYDEFGNLRNIAHVGVTGNQKTGYNNSLERFDDGTIIWTCSNHKAKGIPTGSAALKDNGEIILIAGDPNLAKSAARNLGAEGINEHNQTWTGQYSESACIPEAEDRFIIRREYKNAVRKQANQIVDGACIPGLEPIFKV